MTDSEGFVDSFETMNEESQPKPNQHTKNNENMPQCPVMSTKKPKAISSAGKVIVSAFKVSLSVCLSTICLKTGI